MNVALQRAAEASANRTSDRTAVRPAPAPAPGTRASVRVTAPAVGATPGDAKQHNRALVLRTLYADGPVSRADVARLTGLTKVTVSGLVGELIADGLVRELGQRESQQRPGKPAILVDLARSAHGVLCIDLSDHRRFRGAILDLDGNALVRRDIDRDDATGDDAVELAVGLALELQPLSPVPLLGIGVGSPGIVDDHGVVRTSPNFEWKSVPLQQIIADRTGVTTVIANDADVSALAEYRFGETSEDFILITIGQGVGSGLILNGHPVTGSSFALGEIGQVMVGTDLGLTAEYSREQVLEHWLSVPAITRALAAGGEHDRAGSRDHDSDHDHDHDDKGDRFDEEARSASQQRRREAVLREAGMRLGVALAPVIGVLNLSEVVLAGPNEIVDGPLGEATLEMLRRRTMPDSHSELALHSSTQGEDIVLRGALATVLKQRLGIS